MRQLPSFLTLRFSEKPPSKHIHNMRPYIAQYSIRDYQLQFGTRLPPRRRRLFTMDNKVLTSILFGIIATVVEGLTLGSTYKYARGKKDEPRNNLTSMPLLHGLALRFTITLVNLFLRALFMAWWGRSSQRRTGDKSNRLALGGLRESFERTSQVCCRSHSQCDVLPSSIRSHLCLAGC